MVSIIADPPAVGLNTSVIGLLPSGAPTATQVPVRAAIASNAAFLAAGLSFGSSALTRESTVHSIAMPIRQMMPTYAWKRVFMIYSFFGIVPHESSAGL